MKKLHFISYTDFAAEISDMYDTLCNEDEFSSVSVIAKYDEARQVIEELICMGYPIANIQIESSELDAYNDEFIVELGVDGIWCERAKRNGEYIWCESSVTYLLDNCSSKIIPYLQCDVNYEIALDTDDECDTCDCDCCKESSKDISEKSKTSKVKYEDDSDEDMHGFTVSKSDGAGRYESYSIYSTREYPIESLKRLVPDWFK